MVTHTRLRYLSRARAPLNLMAGISTKLGTMYPWVKGIQVCSNEGRRPFPRKDNYKIVNNTLTKFKKLLLPNHWANFNQT